MVLGGILLVSIFVRRNFEYGASTVRVHPKYIDEESPNPISMGSCSREQKTWRAVFLAKVVVLAPKSKSIYLFN